MTNSFLSKVVRSRSNLVYFVQAKEVSGNDAWYYILVDRVKEAEFKNIHQHSRFNLSEYGKILASGYGNTPPPDVADMMRNDFGFEPA